MKKVMLGGKQVTFRAKISKSKQELARIISENGGWREGEFAAQDGYDTFAVWFFAAKPVRVRGAWVTDSDSCQREIDDVAKIPNWHQTVLSRAEYLHLYPAPDAEPEFCESVMRSIPEPEAKPTIEQLAADYRNAKDYAERKQQEADDAKVDADARLAELIYAGEALGLMVSPITTKQEPELVITDWRDLQAGDVISVSGRWWKQDSEYTVDENDGSRDAPIRVGGYWAIIGECSFKFIRRP